MNAATAAYVERTVAAAPPLTPQQRDRLTALLRATGEGHANGVR